MSSRIICPYWLHVCCLPVNCWQTSVDHIYERRIVVIKFARGFVSVWFVYAASSGRFMCFVSSCSIALFTWCGNSFAWFLPYPLQWRHNRRDGVSNHRPRHCLLNRLFMLWSKKTSKLRVTGLCVGNSPMIGEFPAQMASNAEKCSHLTTSSCPWDTFILLATIAKPALGLGHGYVITSIVHHSSTPLLQMFP